MSFANWLLYLYLVTNKFCLCDLLKNYFGIYPVLEKSVRFSRKNLIWCLERQQEAFNKWAWDTAPHTYSGINNFYDYVKNQQNDLKEVNCSVSFFPKTNISFLVFSFLCRCSPDFFYNSNGPNNRDWYWNVLQSMCLTLRPFYGAFLCIFRQ